MKVVIAGDLHCPCDHPGYLPFIQDLQKKYKCDTVVLIGDCVDHHAISFHAHHPDCPGPSDEYALALECIQRWYAAFPKAWVTTGNHDCRIVRLAESVNIPSKFLRNYADIWETPGWKWVDDVVLDDVYYHHGTGCAGIHPAYGAMQKMLMSVVQGHVHSSAGIKWRANPYKRIFAMDTGCGVLDSAMAFAYGRAYKIKSILSAGVVIDGIPYHEIMPCGQGERYHQSRFKKKGSK